MILFKLTSGVSRYTQQDDKERGMNIITLEKRKHSMMALTGFSEESIDVYIEYINDFCSKSGFLFLDEALKEFCKYVAFGWEPIKIIDRLKVIETSKRLDYLMGG